jgi:hypothetical protein
MAYLGHGCYKEKMALRAMGVFPSWDRLVFAVRERTGIRSIEEIKKKKYRLRVSTRSQGSLLSTLYVIDEVLKGQVGEETLTVGQPSTIGGPIPPLGATVVLFLREIDKTHAAMVRQPADWDYVALSGGQSIFVIEEDRILPMGRAGLETTDRYVTMPVASSEVPAGLGAGAIVDVWLTPTDAGTGASATRLAEGVSVTGASGGSSSFGETGGHMRVTIALAAEDGDLDELTARLVAAARNGEVYLTTLPGLAR